MADVLKTHMVKKDDQENDQENMVPCSHCGGRSRLSDRLPKSKWHGLGWLSFDGEICNSCGGSGKVPLPRT